MREIEAKDIKNTIFELSLKANFFLRKDIFIALKEAYLKETNRKAKAFLKILLDNALVAQRERIPLCQDTGMVVVFVEIGDKVKIIGDLIKAINEGVREAYIKGYLRKSLCEPLSRTNTSDNTPVIIYTRITKGDKLRLILGIKGFGAENKSQIRMFEPTATWREIKNFILKVVKEAGPDACPPYVIGVGIGGTFEYAGILAKEATLRKIESSKCKVQNEIYKLEKELLREINRLNIGPMGLGGKNTCLAVNILTHPTHIAGLPVAVNISCHATRSAEEIL